MSLEPKKKRKVAFLIHVIAPYRVPVYEQLGKEFDLAVFYGGKEYNAKFWGDTDSSLDNVKIKKSWGIVKHFKTGTKGQTYDDRYFHLTPGFLWDLIRFRPAAIVSHEMGVRSLLALFYGFLFWKPVWIGSEVTLHTERNIGRLKRFTRWMIARFAKRWISYGKAATEYLISLNIDEKNILEIQNTVDEQRYIKSSTSLENDFQPRPVLLCVGRLIMLKGIDKLFEAAARLQAEGCEFTLLLVGDGPEEQKLRDMADKLGLKNVIFHGPHPARLMPEMYSAADVLVFPTLDDVWGLVVNEALWSGLPAISSIYAGCAKELLPPENLFDPLDADDFAKKIRKAIDQKIAAADASTMLTYEEVAKRIAKRINDQISQ